MDDPYTILNIYPDCTIEEAKAAYRKAALLHHPDRHPPARKPEAERRFRILAQAFQQVCKKLGHPVTPSEVSPGAAAEPKKSTAAATRTSPALSRSTSQTQRVASHPRGAKKAITAKPEPNPPSAQPSTRSLAARPPAVPPQSPQDSEPDALYQDGELDPPPSRDRCPSHLDPPSDRIGLGRPDQAELDTYHPPPTRAHPPLSRRSSFSHPGQEQPSHHHQIHPRGALHDHDHLAYGSKDPHRQPQYPSRGQLYNLDQGRRDKDWDLGFGGDDFFSSGPDRFGPMSAMMQNVTSGFDSMMSSAFQGLSMAGPDPAELARMDGGSNCSMRMRQSKMVMGRTEDGSWAGKRMEKQMNMSNGRLEVNENAQDIRLGGRSGNTPGGSQHYPPRNGNMRSNAEDWDPPPAYQGSQGGYGGYDAYEEPGMNGYQPAYHHPQGRSGANHGYLQGGMGGPVSRSASGLNANRDMIPTRGRHGSLSRMSHPHMAGESDQYDDIGPPRGLSSRFDYGSDVGYHTRDVPMGRRELALGHAPSGRALIRRASGEVSTRF